MRKSLDKGAGSDGLVLCDVPGLIAGAARGVGLGHAFLRHVERCHVIVHLIDATSNDPVADYEMLNEEILKYGTSQLATMPQVVVVNKIDAFEDTVHGNDWEKGLQVRWSRDKLEQRLREVMPHTRLMWMSAREREGVDDLMLRLASFVKKVKYAKFKLAGYNGHTGVPVERLPKRL
jgi:GTPase